MMGKVSYCNTKLTYFERFEQGVFVMVVNVSTRKLGMLPEFQAAR